MKGTVSFENLEEQQHFKSSAHLLPSENLKKWADKDGAAEWEKRKKKKSKEKSVDQAHTEQTKIYKIIR